MQVNYSHRKQGKISSIQIDVKSKDVLTVKGRERFLNLMRYFVEYFINELELNQANYLLDYASMHNFDISNGIILKHPNGNALCTIAKYSKLEVRPLISLDSTNLMFGWTFERGLFADINIYTDNEYVLLIEKDSLYEQDLFLYWIMEKIEENFYSNVVYQTYPIDTSSSKPKLGYRPYEDSYPRYEKLVSIVEDILSVNKSVRIDKLVVDGLTADEYIIKNRIYQYANSEQDLFKMCLYFKKPYNQVRKFVESKQRF